jgi:DnaJ-class molecular chaperone
MASNKSYYEILGVSEKADETEIKKAYRSLSLKHHPDRGGDSEKFKEISEAFQTLSDSSKRRMYDLEQQGGGVGLSSFFGDSEDPLQGLFQNFFGGVGGMSFSTGPGIRIFHTNSGGQGGIPEQFSHHPFFGNFIKPQAIHLSVAIDLEQVLTGCIVPIEFERFVIRDERRIPEKRVLEVAIHQGVEDGEIIHLPDMGNSVNGITGDVKVTVQIVPHALFRRDGLNLHYIQTITLLDALCGLKFEIPLLNKNTITIKNMKPPVKIIYPNMKQVCPGYGLRRDSTVGALIIEFNIQFPESLTPEQQDMLRTVFA